MLFSHFRSFHLVALLALSAHYHMASAQATAEVTPGNAGTDFHANGGRPLKNLMVSLAGEHGLIGGQAACIFVDPGSDDLLVTSTIPYEPESKDEEACKSPVKRLQLAPNENRVFMIWPATKGSSYACGWRIEPTSPSHVDPKKTQRP